MKTGDGPPSDRPIRRSLPDDIMGTENELDDRIDEPSASVTVVSHFDAVRTFTGSIADVVRDNRRPEAGTRTVVGVALTFGPDRLRPSAVRADS